MLAAAVTEKIVTAMLGGAVPIYWGPKDVGQIFNPRSFIDCTSMGDDDGIDSERHLVDACAARVAEVSRNIT